MTIIMTVRNPIQKEKKLPLYIEINGSQLSKDWVSALKIELERQSELEKNYCFHGFPNTQRNLEYLTNELSRHASRINNFNQTGIWQSIGLEPFELITKYTPETVMIPFTGIDEDGKRGGGSNQEMMNIIHNYFEHLQGTVENLSPYYKLATPEVKYSIRQLNNLCHEIETLCLTLKKKVYLPEWIRPSQINTFLNAHRYNLTNEHREGFKTNSYDRKFAHVYMHWTQIGKTLMEVFRDEGAPKLDQATCDAITHLQYYSGEFDIEWGINVTFSESPWHRDEVLSFNDWLRREGYDPNDVNLSLGYLELGYIDLERSFGTTDIDRIWEIMGDHQDVYQLSVDGITSTYDYTWADNDYEQRQINYLMPGYRSHV